MATLTARQRKNLPDSAFAGPGRSYPVPDASHAANAKARAAQMVKKGLLSQAAKAHIDMRANEVMKKLRG